MVVWNAITHVAAEYQRREYVKTARRPSRSAANAKASVPTNSPTKVAATNAARPLIPRREADPLVNIPLRTRPGPM